MTPEQSQETQLAVLASEMKGLGQAVQEVKEGQQRTDTKIDNLKFIQPDVYLADKTAFHDRLKDLERFKDYVMYGVFGLVLAAVVTGVLVSR